MVTPTNKDSIDPMSGRDMFRNHAQTQPVEIGRHVSVKELAVLLGP